MLYLSTSHYLLLLISLVLILVRNVTPFEVQNQLFDKIGAGDARFYTVESKAPVIIALISGSGDADMYASPTTRNSYPSPEDYDYTSSSCGLDVVVLDTSKEQSKMTVGVYGHMRYEETSYRLYVISPSEEDIKRYQIWDWDPESSSFRLLIDMDLLHFSNDHTLHRLLDDLLLVESVKGIWDWDPESNIDKLLIDVDPLYFANDPTLNQLLDTLTQGGVVSAIHGSSSGGKESMLQTAIEWTGVVLLKLAQIAIEILV